MSKLTHEQAMKGLHRALELARVANQPEPGSETIEEILDRAFVSPRIVDQTVVEDWSSRMREVLQTAAAQQKGLSSAAAEFKSLEAEVGTTLRGLQQKMELAIKIIPTLDQRIEKTEAAINKATAGMNAALEKFEAAKSRKLEIDRAQLEKIVEQSAKAKVAGMMDEYRSALEQMVRETIANLATQADGVLAGIRQTATSAAESLVARADRLQSAIVTSGERHQTLLEASAAHQVSRVEALASECQNQMYLTAAMGQADLTRIGGEQIAQLTTLSNIASDVLADLAEHATTSMTSTIITGGHELRTGVQQIVDIAVLGSHAVDEAVTEAARLLQATEESSLARLTDAAARIGRRLGEAAREDADMLSQTALDAVARVTSSRDQTMQSLTRSAGAMAELTAESRETVRAATQAALETALERISREMASSRESLEARMLQAQMIIDACSQSASRTREEIDSVCSKAAASVEASRGVARSILDSMEAAGLSLSERLNTSVSEFESRIERDMVDASTEINESVREAVKASNDLRQGIQQASARAADHVAAELCSMDERLRGYAARAEQVLAQAREIDLPAIEHAATMAESATAKALNSASHLNASLDQADRLRVMVERAMTDLDQLRTQAEFARRQLAESVLAGAEHVDHISEQLEKLRRNSAA
jgi:hypothetical protein